jgi:nicotinate-nucleotide adenylyltransferase
MLTASRGLKVGLLGGSFDPPHRGHLHISKVALKRFDLDQVWWLVSPGNPLKQDAPARMEARLNACRTLVDHPRIRVTDFETRVGTRYTAQTLAALFRHYPQVRFTWLMGADNLAQFHRWQRWKWIIGQLPIGVIARPGDRISARMSKTATIYRTARLQGGQSRILPDGTAPRWCFINAPMLDVSSSAIRARGEWNRE